MNGTSMQPVAAEVAAVEPGPSHTLRYGPLEIDVDRLRVSVSGRPVVMTAVELKLLFFLARHPDWVFSRQQLLAEVWGSAPAWVDPRTVDVSVCRLRRKLGVGAPLVETVRSFGYRLKARTD